jgi:hypothetical protein
MTGVGPETDAHRPKQAQPPLERAIAELASAQHAVGHAIAARGLGPRRARRLHRVQRGMLHRIHRGVYAVGHPLLTREGRWMAAVRACGRDAVLSHRSAASTNARGAIDVTVPSRAGCARDGIDVHRGAALDANDITSVSAIPCTSVARALLDLAEVVSARGVERAIEQAEILRLFDMRAIDDDVLARADGRRGAAVLRAVLATIRLGTTLTRGELEERFLAICRQAALPRPEINAWVPYPDGGGAEADFLWREQRLIVEVDGRDVHTTRHALEHDRRREPAPDAARLARRAVHLAPAPVRAGLRRRHATSAARALARGRPSSGRARRPRSARGRSRGCRRRARSPTCPGRSRDPRSSRRPCR